MKRIIYVFFAVFITAQASGQIRNITTRDTSVFSRAAKTETLPNKTLTAPKIVSGGSINDQNNNELLKFIGVTSAVNEITVSNEVAGGAPFIAATGGDANIPLLLKSKGNRGLRFNGTYLPQSTQVVNIKEDILERQAQPNAVGNGSTNDKGAFEYGLYSAEGDKKVLYLPAGTYLIKSQINLHANGLTIRGAGMDKTIIQVASDYSGTNALFVSAGKSDINIEDLSITGNAKAITAAFEINSYSAANTQSARIKFQRVRIYNFWGKGIKFGGTTNSETHKLDQLTIDGCIFENIGNPAIPVNYLDSDAKYDAIDLNQTTQRAIITNNFFSNIAGNGITSYGQSQTAFAPNHGNWIISGNHISMCFMGIEINGNILGKGLKISDNIIKYSTRNGGYLISIDGDRAEISDNTLYGIERGLIEYTGIGGIIKGNIGSIVPYSSTSGGVALSAADDDLRCAAIEAYGFANLIEGNNFVLDRTSPGTYTPTEFNGIKLIARTTDVTYQPLAFDGITDLSGYWDIKGNTIHGFTHRAIDATNEKIRKVNVIGNTFLSRVCIQRPLAIYGYHWAVKGNVFDLTGSSNPSAGEGAIGVFATQSDNTLSIVTENTIINDNWKIADTDKLLAFNNHLVNTTTNLAYQMFPAPPMTAAQRTALTGVEGMTVYQTDATAGVYVYKGGAWAAL